MRWHGRNETEWVWCWEQTPFFSFYWNRKTKKTSFYFTPCCKWSVGIRCMHVFIVLHSIFLADREMQLALFLFVFQIQQQNMCVVFIGVWMYQFQWIEKNKYGWFHQVHITFLERILNQCFDTLVYPIGAWEVGIARINRNHSLVTLRFCLNTRYIYRCFPYKIVVFSEIIRENT